MIHIVLNQELDRTKLEAKNYRELLESSPSRQIQSAFKGIGIGVGSLKSPSNPYGSTTATTYPAAVVVPNSIGQIKQSSREAILSEQYLRLSDENTEVRER